MRWLALIFGAAMVCAGSALLSLGGISPWADGLFGASFVIVGTLVFIDGLPGPRI